MRLIRIDFTFDIKQLIIVPSRSPFITYRKVDDNDYADEHNGMCKFKYCFHDFFV